MVEDVVREMFTTKDAAARGIKPSELRWGCDTGRWRLTQWGVCVHGSGLARRGSAARRSTRDGESARDADGAVGAEPFGSRRTGPPAEDLRRLLQLHRSG